MGLPESLQLFDETQVKGHEKKIPPLQLTPAYRAQLEFKGTVLRRGSGIAEVVERAVSKSVVPLTGNRGFEPVSLQRRVRSEPRSGRSQAATLGVPRGLSPIRPNGR
jgi:hypothetical protein